jgi:uncharacterized membrane protein YfhO
VHASSAGVVLVNEAYWPKDVRIFVNGHKEPIIRLNHAFMGVAVKAPGDYQVEVRYIPAGWYHNIALAALGVLLLVASGFAVIRLSPRRQPAVEPVALA